MAIRGVLVDIAGVLTDQGKAIQGAVSAIEELRRAGIPMRLVTNTTSRPRQRLLDELSQLGFDFDETELFTPAGAAVAYLSRHELSPHLLIHPDLDEDFADCVEGRNPAVVVGDAGEFFTFDRLNAAFREVCSGAPLLALAMNRTFRDRDGELSIDAGAFVHALEYASGSKPVVLGKPALQFFELAARSMGCALSDCAMIGDDAEADIAGALKTGVAAAYLVQTGKYREGDETRFKPVPTAVVADVTEAVERILG
ncbi:MAG: TIGR01458 family HAD-type hydrolase [Ruegeria sp.]